MSYTLTDSSALVTLYPEYDFKDAGEKVEERHRTRGGAEFRYNFGSFDHFEFSVKYVNSADAYQIQQWWTDSTSLFFTADGNTYMLRIANNTKPLGHKILPYDDLFDGSLILESF